MAIFTSTEQFKKSLAIINRVNSARFPLLLTRIVQKVHLKEEATFSDDELDKLTKALDLSATELQNVIDSCEFIFHQAAYHSVKPAVLAEQLQQMELAGDKVTAFAEVWANSARDVLTKLQQHSVLSSQLTSVNWRLCLHMGQKTQADVKKPVAMLELKINDGSPEHNRSIRMEFSHAQLYAFYSQLEMIQRQLDSLT